MKLFIKIFAVMLALALVAGGLYLHTGYRTGVNTIGSVKNDANTTTFLAVGDIMLSRDVAAQMEQHNKDGLYPFANILGLLSSTDFNFANLESPFSGTDEQDPDPNTFTFNAPTYALRGLVKNNFKVLNLANNHAMNQGKDGVMFTKKYLLENDILGIGTGANAEEAWQGGVYTAGNGTKIGFAGATYGPNTEYLAQTSDLDHLKETVARLKMQSDFVVVTMHAGEEYTREPTAAQTKFAQAAIDDGADIVIGAHPHWIQPFEKYKGKYIFYSLGNFVFDQSWSQDTKEGLTLKITLDKTAKQVVLKQIELVPVIIEHNSQPRLATEAEQKSIFKKIGATTNVITPQ
ncbi:MAG TPA: CapA family protein [Patescibacteria group bacterium]|jgi:poly-gamma-glutamate synthesis protein (capsule biosynthesis protein)|nr:CapA family protein [Patescibacteria group bacterium]